MTKDRSYEPTAQEIGICAYLIYQAEGCPQGRALEHWLQAEAQLAAARRHGAGRIDSIGPEALHPSAERSAGNPNATIS